MGITYLIVHYTRRDSIVPSEPENKIKKDFLVATEGNTSEEGLQIP